MTADNIFWTRKRLTGSYIYSVYLEWHFVTLPTARVQKKAIRTFPKLSVYALGGDILSRTISAGYIVTSLGGDKWLYLWVSHWLIHLTNLFKTDSFTNETHWNFLSFFNKKTCNVLVNRIFFLWSICLYSLNVSY